MTDLDRLPPDQRAVLSLVLERGKSYAEVAELLAIPESTVRDRAHAALDALARHSAPPSAAAGAGGGGRLRERAQSSSESRQSPRAGQALGTSSGGPGSRRGGALLLALIGVVIVVVVIVLLATGGGGKSSNHNATASNTSTTNGTGTSASASTGTGTTSTSGQSKVNVDKTIPLSPFEPSLKATGRALVLSEGSRYAFYIAAQGLPPSQGFFYAVWLYNSPSSAKPLGRAPTVSSSGTMEGGGPLPNNAADYGQLIITRETSTHPSHPGPIVMKGPFALH